MLASLIHASLANVIISSLFGIFVWLRGPRQPVQRLWMCFCLLVGVWSLGYGMMVNASTFSQAYFWQESCVYPGSILLPVVFFHFVLLLTHDAARRLLIAGYLLAAILMGMNVMGVLGSVRPQPPFHFYSSPLRFYGLYLFNFFAFVTYAHVLLIRRLLNVSDRAKNQLKFVLLGTSIAFCGGITTFFPVFNIPIFPYGIYVVPIYVFTISYAIFKHELMDMNVVIRKALLFSFVSAGLLAIYAGAVTFLARVFEGRQGSASAISSALAAIFITLLFNPLTSRIQRWINRRFPKVRLDPELLQEAAGGFAHEMKRPLSRISLPAELTLVDLQQVKTGAKNLDDVYPLIEQRMQYIIHQSQDAGHMIEAIRELSSFSSAPFEAAAIQDLIQRTLSVEAELIVRFGARIDLQLPEDPLIVKGRARQLEIVFINVIKNALEAMDSLPTGQPRLLRIEGKTEDETIVLSFIDNGPGIMAGNAEKMFQPHFTTKGARGTGMGLYLSAQIIQAHGGSIEASTNRAQGACLTIRLPKMLA